MSTTKATKEKKPKKPKYKMPALEQVVEHLGGKPSQAELDRLVKYYPNYDAPRRFGVLHGYFDGMSIEEIVKIKFMAENISSMEIVKQAKGGHTSWAPSKIKNLIIRILYLRYRIDKEMTQRDANGQIRSKDSNALMIYDGKGWVGFLDFKAPSTTTRKTKSRILDN